MEVLEKYATLASNVDSLKKDMHDVKATLTDIRDRLVRLEASGDLIAEKAKNAALGAVTAVAFPIQKEIADLQAAARRDGIKPAMHVPRALESSTKSEN